MYPMHAKLSNDFPTHQIGRLPALTHIPGRSDDSADGFDAVVDASRRRIALTLNDIDVVLSQAKALSLLLEMPVVDSAMERRVLRPRSVRRSRSHASDKGIGSLAASTNEKAAATDSTRKSLAPPPLEQLVQS
ncbi:hypothetical protein ACHAPE_009798 [Trichoderma viride]